MVKKIIKNTEEELETEEEIKVKAIKKVKPKQDNFFGYKFQ